MPIELSEPTRAGLPVLRQQRIGETAHLAIVRYEQRNRIHNGEPIPNGNRLDGTPKFKQELVIYGIVMPDTTMEAKLAGEGGVPKPGDQVRLILKAKGYSDYLEARRQHRCGKLSVGDVLILQTDRAQAYDQSGAPKGPPITNQAEVEKLPRAVTVGFYGPISLHEGSDKGYIAAAEDAYNAHQSISLE